MTTSNSTDYSINRDQIITEALAICGVIDETQTPSAAQLTDCSRTLNNIVKELQTKGMPLWALKMYSLPLTANKQSYSIGAGGDVTTIATPYSIVRATIDIGAGSEVPVEIVSEEKYRNMPYKATVGIPTMVYYDRQLTLPTLYIWGVPSVSTYTLKFLYRKEFDDFDIATDTPDFPKYWYGALCWKLASDIAMKYGVDNSRWTSITQMAVSKVEEALESGSEMTSLYIGVRPYGK